MTVAAVSILFNLLAQLFGKTGVILQLKAPFSEILQLFVPAAHGKFKHFDWPVLCDFLSNIWMTPE